jgi:hypothetical protein
MNNLTITNTIKNYYWYNFCFGRFLPEENSFLLSIIVPKFGVCLNFNSYDSCFVGFSLILVPSLT